MGELTTRQENDIDEMSHSGAAATHVTNNQNPTDAESTGSSDSNDPFAAQAFSAPISDTRARPHNIQQDPSVPTLDTMAQPHNIQQESSRPGAIAVEGPGFTNAETVGSFPGPEEQHRQQGLQVDAEQVRRPSIDLDCPFDAELVIENAGVSTQASSRTTTSSRRRRSLQGSFRRTSLRRSLRSSLEDYGITLDSKLYEGELIQKGKKWHQQIACPCGLKVLEFAALCVLVAVIPAVVLPLVYFYDEGHIVIQNSSSKRYRAIKKIILETADIIANDVDGDPLSPQAQALSWLADIDLKQLPEWDGKALAQRYALAVLYFSTGGMKSWGEPYGFLSADHECTWNVEFLESEQGPIQDLYELELYDKHMQFNRRGVLCHNSSLVVKSIIISKNNMTGPLPPELGLLTNLERLVLKENKLTGTIPTFLSGLQELLDLSLHVNKITGTFPDFIGNITSIRRLWLGFNELTGSIPLSINNLHNLEELFLDENKLTGTLPFEVGGLSSLRYLRIRTNKGIGGTVPGNAISSYKQLERLYLGNNSLTGTLPPELGNLPSLQLLEVMQNFMTGSLPASIMAGCTELRWLSLGLNQFTGTIPSEVGGLVHMKKLYMYSNRLEGLIPDVWANMTEMDEALFSLNSFNGTLPISFGELKKLEWLTFANTSITGNVNFLCDHPIDLIFADCLGDEPEVLCECCNVCCIDDVSTVDNPGVDMSSLVGIKFPYDCFWQE